MNLAQLVAQYGPLSVGKEGNLVRVSLPGHPLAHPRRSFVGYGPTAVYAAEDARTAMTDPTQTLKARTERNWRAFARARASME